MSIENTWIGGYFPVDALIDRECNPSRSSVCVDFGDNVLLCRRPGEALAGRLNVYEEIERRRLAVELSKELLPKYTLSNQQVVLQGWENGERVAVLGRFTEKMTRIRFASDISFVDLIKDELVCRTMFDVSFGYLKALVAKGAFCDVGFYGNLGSRLPSFMNSFTRRLTDANVMVGFDKFGVRRCFVDPDWYVKPKEFGLSPLVGIPKRAALLLGRMSFFGSLILVQNVTNLVKSRVGAKKAVLERLT